MRVFVADARRIEGEALAMLGRVEEALAVLRDAKARAAAIGAEPGQWRSALALARLFGRAGRRDQAREEIAVARAGLERVAAQLADPELRRLFEGSDPWRESRAEDSP
jgi:hypothetical protein